MNKRIIESAIEEAEKSVYDQHRVGCIIFNKSKIISRGHNYALKNRSRLNPIFQKWKGSIHAEVDAILNAKKNLKGCDLLVVRINRKNEFRMSMPCIECQKYIQHVCIRKVFYSVNVYPHIKELIL
jgi:deoxycytidylate deaminase